MKDFMILVKAVSASSLTVNKRRNGKTVKPRSFSASMLIFGVLFSLIWVFQFVNFLTNNEPLGLSSNDFIPYLQLSLTSYMLYGFFMCLTFSCSIFFKGNNDIFLSLPISGNRYFMAKLVLTLYVNLVYGGLTILAVGITACIMLHLGILSYFMVVAIFLLYITVTPCLSFLIANLFAGFIDFKNNRSGNKVFTIVVALLGGFSILIITFVSFFIPDNPTGSQVVEILNSYSNAMVWVNWVGYMPVRVLVFRQPSDAIYLLMLLGISALVIFLALFASRKTYLVHLGKTFSSKQKKLSSKEIDDKIKEASLNIPHLKKIALKREFSNYQKDHTLLVNAFMMPLSMMLSLGITLYSLRFSGSLADQPVVLQIMGISLLCFTCYFHVIPFTALSIEKKDWAVIRTLPMNLKQLMNLKLIPSYLMYLPMSVVIAAIYLFAPTFSISYLVIMLCMMIVYPLAMIHVYFYLGVRHPNFNYDNAADLIRKGWINLCHVLHAVFALVVMTLLILSYMLTRDILLGGSIAVFLMLGTAVFFYFASRKQFKKFLNQEITF